MAGLTLKQAEAELRDVVAKLVELEKRGDQGRELEVARHALNIAIAQHAAAAMAVGTSACATVVGHA
jgi:hypothetical protein